ncbi:DUF4232 domain-containing protein [Streptomyces sp. NPDC053750]|uniref:DUF4232 domain-containing protein n=1 Tax=Streptomyces sp. NPDC053750 TaxID=3365714 RepID=UPI0037D3774A
MFRNRRKAVLASVALVGTALLMTACQDADQSQESTDTGASSSSSPVANEAAAPAEETGVSDNGVDEGTGSGADTGDGERVPVEQSCGAGDIAWSTRSETQAGGYILITAKAKPGITCYLPAALPTVAFGSDGTEAGPAEQSVGEQVKLSGDTAAYAGVNPKTTEGDGGKELDSIIVAVGDNDPDPVSLPVGTIVVDDPIVTNWHTSPADAVPFN